ncbi:hypothetical protein [Pseudomonas oryzihabitans]|uniref:Uncharacterized protein n=1 Tax=Pseudomonas oryzihabitans TaxID=47885 RepID=A0A2Z5A0N9_9PSED|nr:hypothetical protein [Pseudomonas oryzihabitans]AXA64365.1 hypothetical protein CE139_00645 [Pseudomonas oryzihabitans]
MIDHADDEESFVSSQLIEAVENQLAAGEPDYVQAVLNKLTLVGYEREEAVLLMAQALSFEIAAMLDADRPFNGAHYERLLRALPELPEPAED